MAKLYFRYGAMNSGKSTALLQAAFNYEERGQRVLLAKPLIDTKGASQIVSRLGVTREVDFVIPADGDVETIYAEHADYVDHDALIESIDAPKAPVSCLLIDEAQFLSPVQVDSLMRIATAASVPVMCYGIRTDFQTKAFPGSGRLLEIAHTLEELKTICRCGRKAMFNGRLVDGRFIFDGDQVAIDGNTVTYESLCPSCYLEYSDGRLSTTDSWPIPTQLPRRIQLVDSRRIQSKIRRTFSSQGASMRIAVRAFNDNPGSPVLVFGNALGTRMPLWTSVAARLADDYQIYLTDLPGHTVANGDSLAEVGQPLTIEQLASGVVESLAEVGVESFAYCGVSISGAVGLTLALNHPDVLTGLIACATAEKFGSPESWDERIGQVRADGTRSVVDDTADRWFAAGFLGEDIATGHLILTDLALIDDEAYIAAASALKTYDLGGKFGSISTPTLVVAGAQDPGCTPETMSEMAQQIEGAHFVTIPDSAHLPMAEHPEIVADHIQEFCGQL